MRIVNPVAIRGEDLAVEFLQKKGYEILERNFRKQYGEIDIIAIDPGQGRITKIATVVFIEVKTRTSLEFGTGLEAISASKLRSLIKTAQFYKKAHPKLPENLRIDAISILLARNGELTSFEHIENISG